MKHVDAALTYQDAKGYDLRSDDPLQRYVDSKCDPIINYYLRHYIKSGDVVCDLGAGTLEHTRLMKKAGHIYAVEINPKMIAQGRPKVAGLKSKLTLLNEDATKTSIPSQTVDVVWSIGLAEYLDLEKFFAEVSRIIKPGGKLILQFQNKNNPHNFFAAFIHAVLHRPTKNYRTLNATKIIAGHYGFSLVEFESRAVFFYLPISIQKYFIWLWQILDYILGPFQRLCPTGVNIFCVMTKAKQPL